jgi:hypothetical protein
MAAGSRTMCRPLPSPVSAIASTTPVPEPRLYWCQIPFSPLSPLPPEMSIELNSLDVNVSTSSDVDAGETAGHA